MAQHGTLAATTQLRHDTVMAHKCIHSQIGIEKRFPQCAKILIIRCWNFHTWCSRSEFSQSMPQIKKKKTDYEALNSTFMKIPHMKIEVARDLIDLGFSEIYQLSGRAPEVLFEDLNHKRTFVEADRLAYFKMAVYFAEQQDPDPQRLHPSAWHWIHILCTIWPMAQFSIY